MTRTALPALSAAALLGLALLVPAGAGAAGETCQGRTATVVGALGHPLVGTEGPDVIASNGASRVDALGGDDLICVTGPPAAGPDEASTLTLSAGTGNDVVEAVTRGWGTFGTLGLGADTYTGTSSARHEITAGEFLPLGSDREADTIRVASGLATIYSGAPSVDNPDVIEIDAGTVQWTGLMTRTSSVSGGRLSTLRTVARRGDARIDAARGTAAAVGSYVVAEGFGAWELATTAFQGTVRFRGTSGADRLRIEAPTTYDRVVDLRGGRDFYESDGFGSGRSSYDGGRGRDQLLLAVTSTDSVDADLDDGRFVAREGKRTVRRTFDRFEDLVLATRRARVDGTPRGEEIVVIACRTTVSADGGRDVVRLDARLTEWQDLGCARRSSVDGGGGDDVLSGSRGPDRLVGGPGRDVADGHGGRDSCRAEEMTSCEVRR